MKPLRQRIAAVRTGVRRDEIAQLLRPGDQTAHLLLAAQQRLDRQQVRELPVMPGLVPADQAEFRLGDSRGVKLLHNPLRKFERHLRLDRRLVFLGLLGNRRRNRFPRHPDPHLRPGRRLRQYRLFPQPLLQRAALTAFQPIATVAARQRRIAPPGSGQPEETQPDIIHGILPGKEKTREKIVSAPPDPSDKFIFERHPLDHRQHRAGSGRNREDRHDIQSERALGIFPFPEQRQSARAVVLHTRDQKKSLLARPGRERFRTQLDLPDSRPRQRIPPQRHDAVVPGGEFPLLHFAVFPHNPGCKHKFLPVVVYGFT